MQHPTRRIWKILSKTPTGQIELFLGMLSLLESAGLFGGAITGSVLYAVALAYVSALGYGLYFCLLGALQIAAVGYHWLRVRIFCAYMAAGTWGGLVGYYALSNLHQQGAWTCAALALLASVASVRLTVQWSRQQSGYGARRGRQAAESRALASRPLVVARLDDWNGDRGLVGGPERSGQPRIESAQGGI
jgi:hypothetical protein